LSIIIPVYNEEKTIERIMDRINKVDLGDQWMKEIIIVNDCSTDGSADILYGLCNKHGELDIAI